MVELVSVVSDALSACFLNLLSTLYGDRRSGGGDWCDRELLIPSRKDMTLILLLDRKVIDLSNMIPRSARGFC